MADQSSAPADAAQRGSLEGLRELLTAATGRLLGGTISVPDDDWRGPSLLPAWSRGHVATHIARQADGLVRLAAWARTGIRTEMYASPDQREDEIQAGALRSGLELQVDLDTSERQLEEAFEAVAEADAWDAVVELRGGLQVPARLLPLARLLEVTLHHVDLDVGYTVADVDASTADWLLEWSAFRLRERDDFPRLELVSPTTRMTVGSSGRGRTVRGSSADLLGWLTGRTDSTPLEGSGGLHLPAF
jgi:maleylpyruvate isomerase